MRLYLAPAVDRNPPDPTKEGPHHLTVRDPLDAFKPLPVGGKWVEESDYWRRRLMDGDVVEATPPAAPAEGARSRKGA